MPASERQQQQEERLLPCGVEDAEEEGDCLRVMPAYERRGGGGPCGRRGRLWSVQTGGRGSGPMLLPGMREGSWPGLQRRHVAGWEAASKAVPRECGTRLLLPKRHHHCCCPAVGGGPS